MWWVRTGSTGRIAISLQEKFRQFSQQYASQDSTIFALASGSARSAVAVVRVSGPKSADVLQEIGRFRSYKFPEPRMATVKKLYDVSNGSLIDNAMVLWFPAPKSYTGEDCCEFLLHGGPTVIRALLEAISRVKGCRMAEAGEFTKRAFLNGKMDLTEVDGLGDLMCAETEMQRIQALKQMTGSLGKLYEGWRNDIAKCLADVEAFIDFGEDENIESNILKSVETRVEVLLEEMKTHLRDSRKGERLRTGVSVAILGKPNVGKSSLLNLLCRRETAIVSDIPGTTRDVLKDTINVRGYPVNFADTAGIRMDPADIIEKEGIRRALKEAQNADVILLLVNLQGDKWELYEDRQRVIQQQLLDPCAWNAQDREDVSAKTVIIGNKLDLRPTDEEKLPKNVFDALISCKTLQGYYKFVDSLGDRVSALCANPEREEVYLTRERYRSHLSNCVSELEEYVHESRQWSSLPQMNINVDLALQAIPLKSAMNSIGAITGHFGTEDILDIIFKDFCIGK